MKYFDLQPYLPWLAMLAVASVCMGLLLRCMSAKWQWKRLAGLHRDQDGSVQSLSFVLTLPLLLMVVLFIVQVSQLMIGTMVVHYAAFSAARSAVVWIPARLGVEYENCISSYYVDLEALDQIVPVMDPTREDYGPVEGGMTFVVRPGSPKYEKIASAAILACAAISPSRDLGLELSGTTAETANSLKAAYASMAPASGGNRRIPARLENKLAYATAQTQVAIRFYHQNADPPLVCHRKADNLDEFYFNELGWQDPITVTVVHNMALLPGPGRLLARFVRHPEGLPDEVAQRIQRLDNVYVYPLVATATLGNEGEKSVIPYVQLVGY